MVGLLAEVLSSIPIPIPDMKNNASVRSRTSTLVSDAPTRAISASALVISISPSFMPTKTRPRKSL